MCCGHVAVAMLVVWVAVAHGARGPDFNRTVFTAEFNLHVFDEPKFNGEVNAVIAPIQCSTAITDDRSNGVSQFIVFHFDCGATTGAAQASLRGALDSVVMQRMHTVRGLSFAFELILGTDDRDNVSPGAPIACVTALAVIVTAVLVFARKRKSIVDHQFELRDSLSSFEEMR
jgi:hypothetical protein